MGARILVHDVLHDTGYLHVPPRSPHVRGWLLRKPCRDTSNASARVTSLPPTDMVTPRKVR